MKTSEVDLEQWADIVLKEWERQIQMLGIGYSDALIDSFMHYVMRNARGDIFRIMFIFNFYGKFVEMAVGRSFPIDFAKSPGNRREAKPWYTRTFLAQVHRLKQLLQAQYAEEAKMWVSASMKETKTIKPDKRKGMGDLNVFR